MPVQKSLELIEGTTYIYSSIVGVFRRVEQVNVSLTKK